MEEDSTTKEIEQVKKAPEAPEMAKDLLEAEYGLPNTGN